jgi:DNA polymerase III delta' subunit
MSAFKIPHHHQVAERIARLGRMRGGISHSILIHGPVGAGHREVAVRFGQSLFCETGDGPFGACGECRNCRRVSQGIHPDWIWMEPDRSAKGLPNISIDLLRALQDRLVLEPFEGNQVAGCIFEAEKMRLEAANSLLKLLEEPPAHALFILVTENRQRILPTIQSRCLPVPLIHPSEEDLAERLAAEFGLAPVEAHQAALWSANEGLDPGEALSEPVRQFREESRWLLDLAVREGEHAFIPALKALKYDREVQARFLGYWRDLLRDSLLLREGRGEAFTYQSDAVMLGSWTSNLSPESYAYLIDRAFEYEEAVLGYASPAHALATFLSEVSAKAVPHPHDPINPTPSTVLLHSPTA